MFKHTPREIIEQCILRWQLSDGFKPDELRHYIEAAQTILDELKVEGADNVR